jgi:hypothetical protein
MNEDLRQGQPKKTDVDNNVLHIKDLGHTRDFCMAVTPIPSTSVNLGFYSNLIYVPIISLDSLSQCFRDHATQNISIISQVLTDLL